ncbi:hypothetical protein F5Y08DRAFT_245127 [Xylaria arbuscula]|nr:hypothetical protein F5Y08DRAFT_245127 [Xylaria arbuscula]
MEGSKTSTQAPRPKMASTRQTFYPTPDPTISERYSTPGQDSGIAMGRGDSNPPDKYSTPAVDDDVDMGYHGGEDLFDKEYGLDDILDATAKAKHRQADYSLRMSHGWTIYDGTFEPVPQDKRRKRDVPYPSYVMHAFRARAGLSSLQLSRDAPISMVAIDIATAHVFRCMPGLVRRFVYLCPPNGPALWSDDEHATERMYGLMENPDYFRPAFGAADPDAKEYKTFSDLKKRPWIIWPIYVEDRFGKDWVTVMWYSERNPDSDVNLFNQLVSYTVIDPRRSVEPDENGRHQPIASRIDRISGQLLRFLTKAGFETDNAEYEECLCAPMPLEEATSGERCFANIKDIFTQMTTWYDKGGKFARAGVVDSLQKWVNPFQMRIEMTGINAFILMASLDFDARISVEAILPNTVTEVAADGVKKWVNNYDLAGPFHEPQLAANDFNLPPTDIFQVVER